MKIIMPINFINCILLLNYLYILSEWWILIGVHFLNPDGCRASPLNSIFYAIEDRPLPPLSPRSPLFCAKFSFHLLF